MVPAPGIADAFVGGRAPPDARGSEVPMLEMVMKCASGAVFLGSLFWYPSADCVALLLVIWAIAIGVLVYSNLVDRFLWIPILLALTGVFGLIFILAIPANVTLAADEATLVMFVASLALFKKKSRSSMGSRSHFDFR